MIYKLIPLFFFCLIFNCLSAQTQIADDESLQRSRYVSPAVSNLQQEEVEVTYFAHQLMQLKEAFAAGNTSKIAVRESAVMMALRNEINQLELYVNAESAQTERRKLASSGQLVPAAKPEEAPARDPLADATTPAEVRLETMQYTLAAFERHAFDPSKPEDAARDFAKLDNILKIMQEALAELKAVRQ